MTRKQYLLIITIVFILVSGCKKQTEVVETTTSPIETTVETIVTMPSAPGVEDSFFDETEATEIESQPQPESTEPQETTKPAETTKPTEATKPQETTAPTQSAPEIKPQSDYENFQNMDAADQQKFMESFKDMDAFFAWYNNAKAEHEAANPPIDVGDGTVDMGDLIGGNG